MVVAQTTSEALSRTKRALRKVQRNDTRQADSEVLAKLAELAVLRIRQTQSAQIRLAHALRATGMDEEAAMLMREVPQLQAEGQSDIDLAPVVYTKSADTNDNMAAEQEQGRPDFNQTAKSEEWGFIKEIAQQRLSPREKVALLESLVNDIATANDLADDEREHLLQALTPLFPQPLTPATSSNETELPTGQISSNGYLDPCKVAEDFTTLIDTLSQQSRRPPLRAQRLWDAFRNRENDIISGEDIAEQFKTTKNPENDARSAIALVNHDFEEIGSDLEIQHVPAYRLRRRSTK